MNIAFEISPLLTASGTFGDKSGVYRYMMGLLSSLADTIKKKGGNEKIILFSFNQSFLRQPVNPEILPIVDNKNVFLLRTGSKLEEMYPSYPIRHHLERLINIRPNPVLRGINKMLGVKQLLEYYSSKIEFETYLKFLQKEFIKHKVKVVFHSETAFYYIGNFKNVITMYDLTPVILSLYHRPETKDLQKRKLRFAQDYCHGIVCISKSTKKDLLNYSVQFKKKKIMIGYPGLDPVFRSSIDDLYDKNSFRELNLILDEYDTSIKKKRYVLFYGTFEPRKNLVYLVEAFSDLQKKGEIPQDFKLVLIGGEGWGKVKKSIDDYVQENFPIEKKNNIIVMDYLNDEYVIKFIKNAYALIYPSLYEGFGLPVLEGMALGTPVISSNSSSLPEVGGSSVLYVDPLNFSDLKDKIRYLINHPRFADNLAKEGFTQSKKFYWGKTAKKFLEFIPNL